MALAAVSSWLADIIKENNCGYAIQPDNITAFANALQDAADNRELLLVMGGSAQMLANRNFHRHDVAEKWVIGTV